MQVQPATDADLAISRGIDAELTIARLREHGAQHFDPVRLRFIEALARRSEGQTGELKLCLDRKLAHALTAFGAAFEQAGGKVAFSEAVPQVDRLGIAPARGPLAELLSQLDQDAAPETGAAGLAELKTMRLFRTTWSRLSVDQQLNRSQEKVPENPGPLNSHLLVLRSLKLMQQISPSYLKRFMSQVDALLWLDQASFGSVSSAPGKPVPRDGSRKRKAGK